MPIQPERLSGVDMLNDVESALALFILRNELLALPQAFSKRRLAQPRALPGLPGTRQQGADSACRLSPLPHRTVPFRVGSRVRLKFTPKRGRSLKLQDRNGNGQGEHVAKAQLTTIVLSIFGAALMIVGYMWLSTTKRCFTKSCQDAKVEAAMQRLNSL